MFFDDADQERKQKRFLHEVEVVIREANRKAIHDRVPDLDRERFVAFATFVAEARADYLAAALAMQTMTGDADRALEVERLRVRRLAFDEALQAFAALERAVERGYVDIA